MSLTYRCLVLDHDDTAVNSTASIHYPAHLDLLRRIRPERAGMTLDEWFRKNFDPGISIYLAKELGLNEQEMMDEYKAWREFTQRQVPDFFPGIIDLIEEFKRRGGIVGVVSHSEKDIIERDYRAAVPREELMPDMIFGWDHDPGKRKPHPFPILTIMSAFELEPREVLMVDDLRPGVEMARSAGIAIAAAGWGHAIPEIRDFMREKCDYYLDRVEDLARLVLG